MTRQFWICSDSNGGFDIGEGDFTIGSIRDIERTDGEKVGTAYREAIGRDFVPREVALLFKYAPLMRETLRTLTNGWARIAVRHLMHTVMAKIDEGNLETVDWMPRLICAEALRARASS